MKNKLVIVKLGGAAITDKNQEKTAYTDRILQIMEQLSLSTDPTIVVHGAGSFGHIYAKEYELTHGKSKNISLSDQLHGITITKIALQELNTSIIEGGLQAGLNCMTFPISTWAITDGSHHQQSVYIQPIARALKLGILPIIHGDICFDSSNGFRVVSGDRIISILAEYFKDYEMQVIFGSNVDGLFSEDPSFSTAELIPHLALDDFDEFLETAGDSAGVDVTGGMRGKLQQIRDILKFALRVDLINLNEPSRLGKLLLGEDVVKTTFSR